MRTRTPSSWNDTRRYPDIHISSCWTATGRFCIPGHSGTRGREWLQPAGLSRISRQMENHRLSHCHHFVTVLWRAVLASAAYGCSVTPRTAVIEFNKTRFRSTPVAARPVDECLPGASTTLVRRMDAVTRLSGPSCQTQTKGTSDEAVCFRCANCFGSCRSRRRLGGGHVGQGNRRRGGRRSGTRRTGHAGNVERAGRDVSSYSPRPANHLSAACSHGFEGRSAAGRGGQWTRPRPLPDAA